MSASRRAWLAAGVLAALASCVDEDGGGQVDAGRGALDLVAGYDGLPTMAPGNDCLGCHYANGRASGRVWTVAGTVFPRADSATSEGLQGVQVLLTDVTGKALTLHTNAAGNFYTAESLGQLQTVALQTPTRRLVMNLAIVGGGLGLALSPNGTVSCNICHTLDPANVDAGAPALGDFGAPGRLFIPPD